MLKRALVIALKSPRDNDPVVGVQDYEQNAFVIRNRVVTCARYSVRVLYTRTDGRRVDRLRMDSIVIRRTERISEEIVSASSNGYT